MTDNLFQNEANPTLFRPTASIDNLKRRAKLYQILRGFFDGRGFVETSTPTLSRDVVVDRFVESIPVSIERCWQERDNLAQTRFDSQELAQARATTFYLQTSPEFAMKRLIAAGMDAIYQLAPAYRKGDRGRLHNLEFTMLEWYRRGDDYLAGRALLAELLETAARLFYEKTGVTQSAWSKNAVVQQSFGEAFRQKTGLNPHACTIAELRKFSDNRLIPYPDSYVSGQAHATKDDWLDLVFSEAVQPELGFEAPVILYDYPASQSQLAQTGQTVDPHTGSPLSVSRRFELFVMGIELANGYDELRDPSVLRERIAETSEERRSDGSPELPKESRLLAAMDAGFPQCAGCALGIDRLLCVLLAAAKIDDVIAFPIELA